MKLPAYVMILLLWSNTSFAQDTTAPDRKPTLLAKGKLAPFDGVLLTATDMADMAAKEQKIIKRANAAIQKAVDLAKIKIDKAEKDLAIEIELGEQREELLTRHIEAVEKWYHQPPFVASAAVVGTVIAILLARETIIEVH